MAPRRQGHVAYGKARVFHHAVAEVHVGLGHAVLGSLSLQLAAGPPQRPRRARMGEEPAAEVQVTQSALTEEQAAMPAFGLELNALMQSHSAKDFKRFRWEMKEWCATPALFRLHHRLIAEKLLRCLLERNAGRYSSKSKHQSKAYADEDDGEESDDDEEEEKEEVTMDKRAHRSTTKKNSSKAKAGDATRGLASEGFEAFARLTIAFARDLQADFLPYFEVFQRALQAGLYDKQGQLLADAARVQLIYAVQAAWCREMMWYWSQKEHRVLVQRIVRLYVAQLSDRKDYLRRLTAELLGYLCRLARPLLPLVIAAATEQLLEAYALYCTAATQQQQEEDEDEEEEAEVDDEQSEAGDDEDNKESVHARDEHTTPTKPALSADPALWSTFVRQELGASTLLDGLASLCAEMLRGMRGALNSAVDLHYRLLLRSFLLCAPDYYRDDEEEDKHDEEEEDGEAQEQTTHDEAASTTMDGHKAQDVVPSAATAPTRWAYLFASPQTTPPPSRVTTEVSAESVRAAPNADRQEKEEEEKEEERTTCVAREIVRAAGCMALSAALQQILHETRKAATTSAAGNEEESDDEEEKKAAQGSDALDMRNPPHKVLSMVVHGLLALPDMNFSLSSSAYYYVHHHHLRLLATVLMAEDGLLLRDEATRHVMREVAKQLRRGLTSMNKLFTVAANNKEESVTCELAQVFAVQYVAALLELLMPLCLGPMLEARKHVASTALLAKERHGAAGVSHALALQEVFLPVGKQCVALALQWSMTTSSERGCAKRRMMMTTTIKVMTQQCVWAFVQDVLQKSYAYALQQEEEEEGKEAMQDGVGAEERSDAASEEEEEEEKAVTAADQATQTTSTSVKTVTADKKKAVAKRLCSTRRGVSGVRSALTPLGLTLLHRIFLVYCERASQQLLAQLRPRTASDVPEHSTHSNEGPEKEENAECAALPQDVRQTLVMLRAAAEQSPRQVCSPLQQLMRLRLARPSSSSSSATQPPEEEEGGRGRGKQVSAGAALQDALEQLLLNIITELTTVRTQTHNNDRNNKSSTSSDMAHALAELLACAWPLVQALLLQRLAQPGKEACVAKMQGALLALMHTVDARAHGDEAEHAARNIHKASAASEALSYTLYVQIAALLMRLSDRPVLSSKGEGSPARVSTRVQGMRYLAESIAMLARGFRSLRIASPTAQANDTEAQVEEEEDRSVQSAPREDNALQLESDEVARYLQLSVAVGGVEAGRRRLFAGAEVLLDSLAWALHHNTHYHNNGDDANNSEEGPAVAAQMTPSRRTREAIALLRQTLCAGRQDTARQLREILFECLTAAQPARVRLRALQLFSLLTHPSLGDTPHVTNEVNSNNNNKDVGGGCDGVCEGEEKNKIISNKNVATEKSALYLPGLTGVDPLVLHALLRAELYNPLAERTGHVDGLRQALTPLLFRCESGQMNGQSEAMRLTRAIVARAMLGLLYRKYAPAWPMAIKILAALVRTRTSKASHNEEEDKEKDEEGDDDAADVWQDVICRYAPLLVLGGQSHAVHTAARTRAHTNNNKGSNDDDGVQSGSEVEVCLYHIRYTLLEQRAASQEQSGGGSSSISGMPGMALAHGNRSRTASSPSSYSSSSLLWSVLTAAAEGNNNNNNNYNSIAHAVVPLLHWQAQSDTAYTNDQVASNSNAFMYVTGAHTSHSQQPQQQMYASSSSSAAARKESERWHTDSATVACSFLAMTAEVMQSCRSGRDERVALVEQLVLALSALHRSAASGSGSSKIQTSTTGHQPLLVAQLGTVRRLEERLVAAMQALAQAPYSPAPRTSRTLATSDSAVTKQNESKRGDDNNKAQVNGAMMQGLFLSYLTEGQQGNNNSSNNTNKLQRAALDNLKRLKVPPFATYYTQLVPYTDTVKALFGFLTTFHIDTDIPVHDRADYLAAALTIALPKLLAKGSKDKLKQQALLRRRLMSLVAQLPDDTSGLAIAEVLQKLVHRLVFASSRGISCTQANTDKKEAADNRTMVQEMVMYDFLGQWRRMVEQSWARQTNNDSHNNTTMSATHEEGNDENEKPTYYVPQHLLRRVERLAKRLTSAMELLEAVLHAIGTRFASYLPACLHLSCQAYLFACTHLLRDTVSGVPRNMIIIIHIPAHTAAVLASLRRAAVTVVQMLFAQLPEQVMSVVREDIIAQCEPHVHTSHSHGEAASRGKTKKAEVEDEEDVLSASLLGRYLHALQLNTRGTQRNAQAAWQESTMNHAHHTSSGSAVQHYSKATPTLRLVTSWVRAPVLRPLLSAYSDFALETLTSLLTLSDSSTNSNGEVYWGGGALSAAALKAAAGVLYEALRDITDILDAADEPMQPLLTQQKDIASKSKSKSKKKASAKKTASSASVAEATGWTTLREAFVRPYITRLFAALYRLVLRGAGEGAEAHTRTTGATAKGKPTSRSSVFSFSVAMWEEIMKTVSLLAAQLSDDGHDKSTRRAKERKEACGAAPDVETMLGKLLEIVLRFVTHPVCATQSTSVTMAAAVVQRITAQLHVVDVRRHFRPMVHLFNVVTNPQARLTLCETVGEMMAKLPLALTERSDGDGDNNNGAVEEWVRVEDAESTNDDAGTQARRAAAGQARTRRAQAQAETSTSRTAWNAQLQAVARAVHCLNSFAEDNTSLEAYDYELRYHTFHSLLEFFTHDGSYGQPARTASRSSSSLAGGTERDAVRQERNYSGAQDVRIPLHVAAHVPVLAMEAFALLAANVLFFLRDGQPTIRALAAQLLEAMMGYAARQPYAHVQTPMSDAKDAESGVVRYKTAVLHEVIRCEVLPSLRRGVVARDTLIRYAHLAAFNGLAKHYEKEFASFARLFARNAEQNFFSLVGHVQPRCRLHALALLRQAVPDMQIRDLLRVFIPFLLTAVKDYAQGKWVLPNNSEGRARGYCDAVLQTIATIARELPWQAYYHVLSLLLVNAREQPALRVVMLRGVVQVLHAFHFLNDDDADDKDEGGDMRKRGKNEQEEVNKASEAKDKAEEDAASSSSDEEEDDDDEERKAWRAKRAQYKQHKILYVLEQDILPQLFDYVSESKQAKKALGIAHSSGSGGADVKGGNPHTAERLRSEQAKAEGAMSKHTLLQLPVAIAITKIIARFPDDKLNLYLDHLVDAVVVKLRSKQHDKQRDRARRMLAAILHEVGPSKLERVLVKLRDNLVHGYQLHVLGYTVVTLLYQLYEPHSALARHEGTRGKAGRGVSITGSKKNKAVSKEAEEKEGEGRATRRRRLESTEAATKTKKNNKEEESSDDDDEREEAALLRQLRPDTPADQPASFDHYYGVECLTRLLPPLMQLLLDSYLGEVGMQKEQVELMSTMVEVKSNRALQGFTLLARHCAADRVLETFLHQITWLLTPPTQGTLSEDSDVSLLHGSARARALIVQTMQQKYTTLSKGAQADLPFVNKVRALAVRVARSLTVNSTLNLEHALGQIRDLLARHNAVREAKIAAFEAKDGTRRIRGNAHIVIRRVERLTRKEQMDKQLLIAPEPERVDVDFSAHTVLATQNKQKLRVYRGRYGKQVQDAAKDFYREDPTTAIVLDTLDEFLLRCLLSTLKKVLGIGRQKGSSAAAVQLDLLRQRRLRRQQQQQQQEQRETAETGEEEEEGGEEEDRNNEEVDDDESENEEDGLEPRALQEESDEDALDRFVTAQEADAAGQHDDEEEEHEEEEGKSTKTRAARPRRRGRAGQRSLAVQFTQAHRALLESLVPVVLLTLRGEGADAVVAEALDCLLALVALQPPLGAVQDVNAELFDVVTAYFGRGGPIKQRAMRVCAGLIAHQKFVLSTEQASQLVRLARAEMIERSEFLPMALRLLHAVLGKHVHVVEVYAIVDIVTELLVHLAAKAVVRQRCLHILVRFLTEYKLTREKFRSHIELLLRNLDFPELAGRLALLELLDQLVRRLPTVILREEAALLLVPLAAARAGAEWSEVREKAAAVLGSLVRGAGLDVLSPLLAAWLQERQPRAQRNVGLQVWSTLLPAVIGMYDLTPTPSHKTREGGESDDENDDERLKEERAALLASVSWSVESVLAGCLYEPPPPKSARKHASRTGSSDNNNINGGGGGGEVTHKSARAQARRGWTVIFYSLRCAESMLTALPDELYPTMGPQLLPFLLQKGVLHAHPWVQAVSLRLMRHYCYNYVEPRAHFLRSTYTKVCNDDGQAVEGEGRDILPFLGLTRWQTNTTGTCSTTAGRKAGRAFCEAGRQTFVALIGALKTVLQRVSMSDVSSEKFMALRALRDPSRTQSLKLMFYLSKAIAHVALSLLSAVTAATEEPSTRKARMHAWLVKEYTLLHHQLHALIAPVLRQQSVVNYLVRSTTLVQFFGAYISVLPTVQDEHSEVHDEAMQAEKRWLAQTGMCVPALLRETIWPLLRLALHAGVLSRKLALLAYQSATVLQDQLAERRALLGTSKDDAQAHSAIVVAATATGKRKRVRDEADATSEGDGQGKDESGVEDVVREMTRVLAELQSERRTKQIRRETHKAMKRSRQEMSSARSKQMPSRSRRGGRKGKASHPATTTSNTAATTHHHAEVVLPPKLNLTNIHAIAHKNNSNDDEQEMRSAKNAAPAFFYTPPQQQQQEKEHQARQSMSSQAEQSVADDAAQKERGNAPDPSASSALVHLTSASDAHILATDKNTGMTTYSNSIENTVNKEHAAPALRHTGPVVTEAWSRSVVHPGDEYLLYQSIEANTLSSSSASAPRSARRTMNTNSSSHHAYYGNTPQRANSLTSNHSPLSLLHERAPRQRQASVQLAQQRQAQLQLQQQRTVRITRLAPQHKTRANPSQANPSGSVPLPPSSASFSRDVSLGSNAQEAPRHGSLTRLVQSATRRRAESMDYATLGQSLARSTSYLRAPSECSLQQASQLVNNPSAATVGAMNECGSVPRGALYSRDNTQAGGRGGAMNDGLVDAQFSFTATENSNDLTTACVKNAEAFAARDEEAAVLSRGETSPVVRANARQARARNAALFFTRPSFYLTEESSTNNYYNYNNTSSVTFAESDGSMADVQQQQQQQQPGYQDISTTQLSAATSTPQSTQYTRSANYLRYDRSSINNGNMLRHGVGRDGEVDEMALMMRRRAELLAQLAPHTKAQDEAAMKEASTKSHTSINTSASSSSSLLYVLPSSLRVRPSMSAAAVPRPTSRLRRLPNIALASIAELQPSNTCTNATTKGSDNTTTATRRSEISKECAALEPVSLQALLMPATNTDEALTPHAKARLQISQDAATVRLLCDPFFPLVSEENYQRLQMCEAEHTARQALALWRNTITCTAAENGAAGENSNNSPMPELPLTAIALDFSEHAEGREKKEEESSTKKSKSRAMKKAQDGTHQGETSGEHKAAAGEASQKATEQHMSTSTSSKASKPQPPYVAPRPIHLSRRVRRRQQQQQQQQQQEARRNAAQGTHESTTKESVEEIEATALAQATTDTAMGKQQEEEAAASEPAVQPVQVEASHNALTLSPTHSPSSSPSRSHTRMTSPNRLLVNAVMPSERTGVVQPLITSVLGFHRSTNTNSAMSSITSPPAASATAAAASTSVTGVLRHSPPKGTAPRSPSPHEEHEKEEKEKKKEEEEKEGTAADTPQRLAAEAAKAEEDAAALLAQTSTSPDGHLTAADEANNEKEEVPALVPCEAAKLNADTARVIGELKDVSAAAAAVTIEKSPEKVAEQLSLVAPVPLIAYMTSKTPYGDELRAYMRHALHQVVHTVASSTGHSEVCHGTNDDDEKVLLRCYFRQLRRELHLERATVQTSTSDAQDTDEENNKAEEDEAGRVTSEMLEDGSYQQENVRYVLETFGAVWQQPEALRSPHVIAPDGKTEGDVARMSAETMGLPPRLCATQLLFQ